MKKLLMVMVWASVLFAAACGASFTGPATQADPSQPCGGHLDCGGAGHCCNEAPFDATDWTCGSSVWAWCPAGTCCFTGGNGPGDLVGGKRGAAKLSSVSR